MVEQFPFKELVPCSSRGEGTLMHPIEITEKCKTLRKEGFTLYEIIAKTGLPKTTVYDHIKNVPISDELKKRLEKINRERTKKASEARRLQRRIVPKPKKWSNDLILIVAHFMFDGEILKNGCVYNNRNVVLINRMKNTVRKVFRIEAICKLNSKTGVHRISYFYTDLGEYIKSKSGDLRKYIKTASLEEKRLFLKIFFDDEGNVNIHNKGRRVRGYQKDLRVLELIQELLKDFKIESKIDKKYKEIIISRKENLIKFRNEINISKGVYINPERKNSVWKQKLEKREILNLAIDSYIK